MNDEFTLQMVKWQARLIIHFEIRSNEISYIEDVIPESSSDLGKFYYFVNLGDYNFYGFDGSSKDALAYYIQALELGKALQNSKMICEALKRILDLYRYNYLTQENDLNPYLDLYENQSYDQLERFYLIYFKQIIAFKHFVIDKWDPVLAKNLLEFAESSEYDYLNARIFQLLASYHSYNYERNVAINYELQALSSLKKIDYSFKSTLTKVSKINLIVYYLESNQSEKAKFLISEFELESRNRLEQDFKKYLFYYQSAIDSTEKDYRRAFHNLSNYLTIIELNNASIINDEIKELEAKYQSEKKEQEIVETQKQVKARNQLIFTVLSFVFILILLIISLWSTSKQLRQRNKKIELLHRELHHRVKNNLQVVSSLMGLQAHRLEDEEAKKAVVEGKTRVKAMSLIHEKLYHTDDIQTLNFRDYIEQLVRDLASSFGFTHKFRPEIQVEVKELQTDVALPLGLILNELVSNSFKHAFEHIDNARVGISFRKQNECYLLEVFDNGSGSTMDIENENSFGMKIVNLLVKQIKGSMEVKNEGGLHYTIKF